MRNELLTITKTKLLDAGDIGDIAYNVDDEK